MPDTITDEATAPVQIIETDLDPALVKPDPAEPDDDAQTFPRAYVEKLRQENGRYREQAKTADDLAHRLHTAITAATGRLAAPDELTFDPAHLDDEDALTAAIDDLLARKPYLAARRPSGDVGQGASPVAPTVDLGGILRRGAS